jgi:hypothetical protein
LCKQSIQDSFLAQWKSQLERLQLPLDCTLESLQKEASRLQTLYLEEQPGVDSVKHTESFFALLVDGHAQRSELLKEVHKRQIEREQLVLQGQIEQLASKDAEVNRLMKQFKAFEHTFENPEEEKEIAEEPSVKRVRWDPELFAAEDLEPAEMNIESKQLGLINVMLFDLQIRIDSVQAWKNAWQESCRVKRRNLVAKVIPRLTAEEEALFARDRAELQTTLQTLDARYSIAEKEALRYGNAHDVRSVLQSMKFAYDVGLESARDSIYTMGLHALKQLKNS